MTSIALVTNEGADDETHVRGRALPDPDAPAGYVLVRIRGMIAYVPQRAVREWKDDEK